MVQILDLASNNFSGKLSLKSFAYSKAMIDNSEVQSELNYLHFAATENVSSTLRHEIKYSMSIVYLTQRSIEAYFQDAIEISIKGLERELVKILTIFTSIDLSCNNLEIGRAHV